jgi:membrane protein
MVLAAQAFTALIPLLILAAAFAPDDNRDVVSDALIGRFHLQGSAAQAVRQVFTHSGSASTGVFSVLLLLLSATSLTRRMQRMYVQAWRLPQITGLRNSLNAFIGLAALVSELALLYFARSLVGRLPLGWVLGLPVGIAANVLLWTSVPWLLLDRRLPWRRLFVGGALTATCAATYGLASTVYMPRLFATYSVRYGLFGVTLALVGWLLCISFIVVAATVVAAELDRAPEPWARRLRLAMDRAGRRSRPEDSPVPGEAPRPRTSDDRPVAKGTG